MADSQNMKTAIAALNALSASELRDLIPHFNQIMKHKRSVEGATVAARFNVGDVLGWKSNKRGRPPVQYMKFMNMNRASTAVVGMECDAKGDLIPPAPGTSGKWTVATSLVTSVNGKPL